MLQHHLHELEIRDERVSTRGKRVKLVNTARTLLTDYRVCHPLPPLLHRQTSDMKNVEV